MSQDIPCPRVSGAPRRSLKASQAGSVKRLLNAAPVGFDILSVLKANDEVQSREDFQDRGAVRSGLMDANFSDVGTQRAPGVELQRQQPPNSTAFALTSPNTACSTRSPFMTA